MLPVRRYLGYAFVGADRIRPQPTKLSGWMNGKSVWLLPLGFPRGEAGFFGNRHFGTDCQKRLMRGSDTLSFQMSRLNGTNQSIYASHPTLSINQPFAAPHQSAGSEVPSDSFPPGEAKWCKPLACTL